MKKIFILFTAVMMLFMSVSCGKSNTTDNTNTTNTVDTNEAKEKLTSDVKISDEFCMGENYINVYVNAFSGIVFEGEESWIMYTEDEIKEVNDISLDDEVKEDDIEVGYTFTDLISYDVEGYDSVMIKYEKLTDGEETTYDIAAKAKADEEKYLQLYTEYEYTDIATSIDKIDVLGSEKDCLYVTSKLDGQDMCSCYVYYQHKNYLVILELSSTDKDGIVALTDNFSTLNK